MQTINLFALLLRYLQTYYLKEVKELKNAEVRLMNFGFAVSKYGVDTRHRGNAPYLSPELLLGFNLTYAADVWALG